MPAGFSAAELFCQSHYSFLAAASSPPELVTRARELGYCALALTDECSLAGIVKAHLAAKEQGLHLLCGSFFRLDDPEYPEQPLPLVLLAPDRDAYAELSTLITRGRRRSAKGEYRLTMADLDRLVRRCFVIWLPTDDSAITRAQGERLRAAHAGRLWLGVGMHRDGADTARYLELHALAAHLDLPMTAANGVLMHEPARRPLLDVLTAIRLNTPVQQLGDRLQANRERHLRPLADLRRLCPPALLEESARIAAACTFSLDELRYEYPRELVPDGMTATQYLRALVEAGAQQRWPDGVPPPVSAQLERELALIAELQYEYYFLTVHDLVAWARARSILCQGRGSAANSAVCFCLGITEVDPARSELLFERFLSRERNEPPDIDVDFEHERREEVIQYIYRKYGRDHAALAATLICYRGRSALRDVGKALGLPEDLSPEAWEQHPQALQLAREIRGLPRHLSQHVGGFVITRAPLATLVPVENAAMADRTIIQWDKDDLEAMGLLKVDVLALGMLTAIRKTLALVNATRTRQGHAPLTMATIPADDAATYDMLCRGDSVGVFQVESRAQMAMLPRLKPRNFYDLVVQVAIVRPGPIQGGMVHPYLRRRNGEETVDYPSEAVRGVLARTLGVPIFQEQVIKLVMVAAGFSGGEADQLRRAMGRWKKTGELEGFRARLVDGMLANGYSRDYAERIFRQVEGFGEYGFPESHAASFALLVYVSAWLKCHHPAAFCCGLLNSLPMGFYSPSQLLQDARRHGVTVHGVDIDHSDVDYTLEGDALRLGLRQVARLGAAAAQRVVAARAENPYANLQDLKARARLDRGELSALVAARATPRLVGHRHQGHWEALAIEEEKPLTAAQERADSTQLADGIQLPAPGETQDMLADYASTGLTLARHPLAILRAQSPFDRCTRATELAQLSSGRFVRVAGVVTGRQRPATASGVLFITLEDETGNINLVVWDSVQQRCRQQVHEATLLLVKGTVEVQGPVVHVVAGDLLDASAAFDGFAPPSRDFH
ncbi:MAG: error-prone DNA polymerase [Gammaproteobacteria bacterium]